jgi:cytochrome c-type biogenesis protein
MLDIGFGAALLAGLISFVSPCVLPIVPPYLAYLAGISFQELSDETSFDRSGKVLRAAFAFVLGFTTVFVALGATASIIGQTVARYFGLLSVIAGIVVILMGLHFMGLYRIGFLYREMRWGQGVSPSGTIGAYIMGLAFAFGWTPCVGPVLAAILFMAGAEDTALRGGALLAVYSLGIGLPFLAAAYFAPHFVRWASRFKRHMSKIEFIMGVLLVATGILFITGSMSRIAQWLLDTFPVFSTIG